eukprot:CAMPEP_0172543126 /NCGR_PEP_ID=MMETSP1067-20121228/13596_1 /TAXON_ID=265564 ORGANISM="Thalassiosira punctigera, Strain Tpunct2005C2" /NCGR_SAMPLE_ID=MMETSP1067 /ASSEMBLY_ACC=CAM_ASM_000444 /LENGTH=310 /DNA_ID=CAMNT_0013329481 /DNA_START=297 /DNA_END=1226 /DNA_ORIENTATION=-
MSRRRRQLCVAAASTGVMIYSLLVSISNNSSSSSLIENVTSLTRGILIIDNRHPDEIILPTLQSVLTNTDSSWQVQLICSPTVGNILTDKNNTPSLFQQLVVQKYGRTLHITPWDSLDGTKAFVRQKNKKAAVRKRSEKISNIMMDPKLWQSLRFEKVLVIQTDSVMCHGGLDSYLRYDYIGAPWTDKWKDTIVGNGGFSLRTRNVMLHCAVNYGLGGNIRKWNEDVFFSQCVDENATTFLGTFEDAKSFVMENVYNAKALAYHKPLMPGGRTDDLVREMCEYCPASEHVPELEINCTQIFGHANLSSEH